MTARNRTPPTVTIGTKPRYTLPEASVLLGISLALVYKRMREGALRVVRDGHRTLITEDEIRRYATTSRA